MANVTEKKQQLETLKLTELKALCKDRGYEGYSSLSKADIIDFIIDMEASIEKAIAPSKPQRRPFRKPSRKVRGY